MHPSELNALAPLRIRGIAEQIRENVDDRAAVLALVDQLLELEPHIIMLLIETGDAIGGDILSPSPEVSNVV